MSALPRPVLLQILDMGFQLGPSRALSIMMMAYPSYPSPPALRPIIIPVFFNSPHGSFRLPVCSVVQPPCHLQAATSAHPTTPTLPHPSTTITGGLFPGPPGTWSAWEEGHQSASKNRHNKQSQTLRSTMSFALTLLTPTVTRFWPIRPRSPGSN